MPINNPQYIIAVTAFLFPATFMTSYGISVSLGHVDSLWPYISDTGTMIPESCVFGQMLNIGSFLLYILFYIRYKQISETYHDHPKYKLLKKMNKISFVFGLLGALGVSIVGNFQETAVAPVHFIGAAMCFGLGSFYMWMQIYLTSYLAPPSYPVTIKILRIFSALVNIVTILSCIVFASIATYLRFINGNNNGTTDDGLNWNKDSEAWPFHLVSTISEWVMAASFFCFLLTMWFDFSYLTLTVNCDRTNLNLDT